MSLNWTAIKMYLTPPLTPPFPNGGVKSFDELIDLSPEVSPAVSDDTTDKSLDELAQMINPVIKGWINYYGHFRKSALYRTFQPLNNTLVRWACRKYKSLRRYCHKGRLWLQGVMHRQSKLFAHWQLSQIKAGQ